MKFKHANPPLNTALLLYKPTFNKTKVASLKNQGGGLPNGFCVTQPTQVGCYVYFEMTCSFVKFIYEFFIYLLLL